MSTVRDHRPRQGPTKPGGGLLTLRALVLLLVSAGVASAVYFVTGEVDLAFAVGLPLLLALDHLVR